MATDEFPGALTEQHVPVIRVLAVAAAAALGGFLFGYDTAVINGAVSAIDDKFTVSSGVLGFAVAIALLGSAVGAWFAGPVANRTGRIFVMQAAAVIFFVSAILTGLAWDIWSLAAFRFISGIGVGAASVIAPAYIAEIAPARMRGRFGSLQQLAIVIGIFVALLVDYALALGAGGSASNTLWFGIDAWRWMFISCAVPAVAYFVIASMIPESPRFLVDRNRLDEARDILRRYVGADPRKKIADIRRTLAAEAKHSFADIRGPALGLLPIVWIGILLSVFQQFVGINVIFYYSTVLWQAVGFSEENALAITVITSVTNIIVTLIAIALVDKVGRKPLLLIGSVGMLVTLAVMAYLFGTAPIVDGSPQLGHAQGLVAIAAANAYVVFFGATWGPVVWVLLGEMFPNRIRGWALAVAAAAQWLANFAVSETFPTLSSISLGIAYGIYAFMALLSLLFVARFVRETKGRELEDMEQAWSQTPGTTTRSKSSVTDPPSA